MVVSRIQTKQIVCRMSGSCASSLGPMPSSYAWSVSMVNKRESKSVPTSHPSSGALSQKALSLIHYLKPWPRCDRNRQQRVPCHPQTQLSSTGFSGRIFSLSSCDYKTSSDFQSTTRARTSKNLEHVQAELERFDSKTVGRREGCFNI